MFRSALIVALALQAAPPPDAGLLVAQALISRAQESRGAFAVLTDLVDHVGPRLSGSSGAEAAVAWAVESFSALGLVARTEPVLVPVWVRGVEQGEILAAPGRRSASLTLTALGGRPGTPPGGLE